jgi:hypothetical protein
MRSLNTSGDVETLKGFVMRSLNTSGDGGYLYCPFKWLNSTEG